MAGIRDLSDKDIAEIKARINRGDKYSDIASDYRINQGRIADLKFGRIRRDVAAAQKAPLPKATKAGPEEKKQFSLL